MSIVDNVKRICLEEAKGLTGAEVVAPLMAFDNGAGLMGVQIKAPIEYTKVEITAQKKMGPQPCEVVANFTLSPNELKQAGAIRMKAALAAGCMMRDIQVMLRPIRKLKDVAPEALVGKPHAD